MTTRELIEFTGGKVIEKRSKSPLKECIEYLNKNIYPKQAVYDERKEILRQLKDFEEMVEVKPKPEINKYTEKICTEMGRKQGSLSARLYADYDLKNE